jgi:hypothetical protein
MEMTRTYRQIIAETKYREIVKWGRELASFDYYIAGQCLQAEEDNAPVNATYKKADGTWATKGGV